MAGLVLLRMPGAHLGQLAHDGDARLALGLHLGGDALRPVLLVRKGLGQRHRLYKLKKCKLRFEDDDGNFLHELLYKSKLL